MDLPTLTRDHPDLVEQVQAEARTQERARIHAILDSEDAAGRETLARHLAFDTDMEPGTAVTMLGKAPKDQPAPAAGSFDQVMREVGNPKIVPAANTEQDDIDATAQRLANSKP